MEFLIPLTPKRADTYEHMLKPSDKIVFTSTTENTIYAILNYKISGKITFDYGQIDVKEVVYNKMNMFFHAHTSISKLILQNDGSNVLYVRVATATIGEDICEDLYVSSLSSANGNNKNSIIQCQRGVKCCAFAAGSVYQYELSVMDLNDSFNLYYFSGESIREHSFIYDAKMESTIKIYKGISSQSFIDGLYFYVYSDYYLNNDKYHLQLNYSTDSSINIPINTRLPDFQVPMIQLVEYINNFEELDIIIIENGWIISIIKWIAIVIGSLIGLFIIIYCICMLDCCSSDKPAKQTTTVETTITTQTRTLVTNPPSNKINRDVSSSSSGPIISPLVYKPKNNRSSSSCSSSSDLPLFSQSRNIQPSPPPISTIVASVEMERYKVNNNDRYAILPDPNYNYYESD